MFSVRVLMLFLVNFYSNSTPNYFRTSSPGPAKSTKESFLDSMPQSMKAEVLVKVKNENPEKQKERQELVRSCSPHELAKITSLSDLPVPTAITNVFSGGSKR